MNKSYYTPTLDEIHVSLLCEVQRIGETEWIPHYITKADIEIRLQFLEQIRLRHLHEDDFRSLGMEFVQVSRAIGQGGEGYIASAKIDHPRKTEVKMEIFFSPSTNWTMITFNGHCVFAGTTMNISELKKTLKRIQGNAIITKG